MWLSDKELKVELVAIGVMVIILAILFVKFVLPVLQQGY